MMDSEGLSLQLLSCEYAVIAWRVYCITKPFIKRPEFEVQTGNVLNSLGIKEHIRRNHVVGETDHYHRIQE